MPEICIESGPMSFKTSTSQESFESSMVQKAAKNLADRTEDPIAQEHGRIEQRWGCFESIKGVNITKNEWKYTSNTVIIKNLILGGWWRYMTLATSGLILRRGSDVGDSAMIS